jgi:hypothetical protein
LLLLAVLAVDGFGGASSGEGVGISCSGTSIGSGAGITSSIAWASQRGPKTGRVGTGTNCDSGPTTTSGLGSSGG